MENNSPILRLLIVGTIFLMVILAGLSLYNRGKQIAEVYAERYTYNPYTLCK